MTHEQALAAINSALESAPAPVSVAVVDDPGELVACLAMDGAARDTLENARRAVYELPWSHAVLRVIELEAYRSLKRHRPGFIADWLQIPREEE